eukprot:TRINITY_DN4286_c0_g1_i14.p1 TRINITY_DN4286_c0_g1~~TRINITY_DN4286_c0_g1_i14.p1  ORF type:complete len:1052 (+),score=55.05 TRINITY_DN4286_c0_g1_i14:43-3198(+)
MGRRAALVALALAARSLAKLSPEQCVECVDTSSSCYREDSNQCIPERFVDKDKCLAQFTDSTWCPDYLALIPPTPEPITPVPSPPAPPNTADHVDHMLIAHVDNTKDCPTPDQYDQYSHVMISSAVAYLDPPAGTPSNECDVDCHMKPVEVCKGAGAASFISDLQAAGKKVILSFGGLGMGSSDIGWPHDCWGTCFAPGKGSILSADLINVVQRDGYDGVDLMYSHKTDNDAAVFLENLVDDLRTGLPAAKTVSFSPRDIDVHGGSDLFNVLRGVAPKLSFIMPRFWDGDTDPGHGIDEALAGMTETTLSTFTALVSLFPADTLPHPATKVVMGLCITDCTGKASAAQAVTAARDLFDAFNCTGGIHFYKSFSDEDGMWSETVNRQLYEYVGCPPPTPAPPTQSPPTPAPPTQSPPTPAPPTQSPPTPAPLTQSPPTPAPPTQSPPTPAPLTQSPPTPAPATAVPGTTSIPDTVAPPSPPTPAPATVVPGTTSIPDTVAPPSPPTPAPATVVPGTTSIPDTVAPPSPPTPAPATVVPGTTSIPDTVAPPSPPTPAPATIVPGTTSIPDTVAPPSTPTPTPTLGTPPPGVVWPPGSTLPPGETLPPGTPATLPPGGILPPGATLPPGGTLPPGSTLPPGATLPPGVVNPAVPGATLPPGSTLPPGATLPPGYTVPPPAVTPPPGATWPPGSTLPPGATLPPGVVNPAVPGATLPPGSTLPPGATLPPGYTVPPPAVTPPPGATWPPGSTLPPGATLPPGVSLAPGGGTLPPGSTLPPGATLPPGFAMPGPTTSEPPTPPPTPVPGHYATNLCFSLAHKECPSDMDSCKVSEEHQRRIREAVRDDVGLSTADDVYLGVANCRKSEECSEASCALSISLPESHKSGLISCAVKGPDECVHLSTAGAVMMGAAGPDTPAPEEDSDGFPWWIILVVLLLLLLFCGVLMMVLRAVQNKQTYHMPLSAMDQFHPTNAEMQSAPQPRGVQPEQGHQASVMMTQPSDLNASLLEQSPPYGSDGVSGFTQQGTGTRDLSPFRQNSGDGPSPTKPQCIITEV